MEQAQQFRLRKRCCTVGKFESFHRGHRRLIEVARKICREVVVVSIRGLGKEILSEEERRNISRQLKIKLVNIPFSRIRDFSPREFMEFLKDLGCSTLIVGTEWRFGKNRAGDVNIAKKLGKLLGIEVIPVEIVKERGEKISTSKILKLLEEGKIEEANELLGYPYFAIGEVIKGEKKGRKIGFPTINVRTQKKLPLPFGVYAVKVYFDGKSFRGISNFGKAPTLKGGKPTLEIFIPGEHIPEIYGKKVKVEFFKFLRPERKFNSVEELINQIKFDLNRLRKFWRDRVGRKKSI